MDCYGRSLATMNMMIKAFSSLKRIDEATALWKEMTEVRAVEPVFRCFWGVFRVSWGVLWRVWCVLRSVLGCLALSRVCSHFTIPKGIETQ